MSELVQLGSLPVGAQFLYEDTGSDIWVLREKWGRTGSIVFAENLTRPDEETFSDDEMVQRHHPEDKLI